MPQFSYKAIQRDGALAEGVLDASGRNEALRQMEGRGLKPIRLAEGDNGSSPDKPAERGALPAQDASPDGASLGQTVTSFLPKQLAIGGPGKISARTLENPFLINRSNMALL